VCAAVFIAAGQTYQISRHCLQHFSNYFHFSYFLLILKGLLHEIFSALPATSKENGEQTIIFRMTGRESRENQGENNQGESRRESRHLENLFTHSINNHQQSLNHLASMRHDTDIINRSLVY
jgi:hypothetical protein